MTRIVVGVDGSPQSIQALRWAFEEARRRQASIVAVHAWNDVYVAGAPFTVALDPGLYTAAGNRILTRSIAEADPPPDVEVERLVVHNGPAGALLDAAEGADLVVVGSRGRGGFTGLLLGSVGQQVLHHATCPVVVIPAAWRAPELVGVRRSSAHS